MSISSSDIEAGRNASRCIKAYEANAKKRLWGYFGAAFWTFQTCFIGWLNSHQTQSFGWMILPALWLVILCYFIYVTIRQKRNYRKSIVLLENLAQKYGANTFFEEEDSKNNPTGNEAVKEREKWGGLYPLFVFCVFLAAIFAISYLAHHLYR